MLRVQFVLFKRDYRRLKRSWGVWYKWRVTIYPPGPQSVKKWAGLERGLYRGKTELILTCNKLIFTVDPTRSPRWCQPVSVPGSGFQTFWRTATGEELLVHPHSHWVHICLRPRPPFRLLGPTLQGSSPGTTWTHRVWGPGRRCLKPMSCCCMWLQLTVTPACTLWERGQC